MRIILMRGVARLAVAATLCPLALTGCGADAADTGGTDVVASAYPFAYVAERIGGDQVDVENLTSPGVEPHDVELAPQQVATVGESDLLVYADGFQPAVDAAVDQSGLAPDALLDITAVGGVDAESDPHVWLDPSQLATIAQAVAAGLAEIDPQGADGYRHNAAALVRELTALDRAFERELASCRSRTVITSHDAFGHLGLRYDLEIVPITGLDPTQEPTPAQQAEIADTVTEEGVTTIFTERLVSPAVAESIASESGARTAVLDPIEGLSEDTGDEDYQSLMRANLEALVETNGCR
jgi:zinc transport system substrate-binding protein